MNITPTEVIEAIVADEISELGMFDLMVKYLRQKCSIPTYAPMRIVRGIKIAVKRRDPNNCFFEHNHARLMKVVDLINNKRSSHDKKIKK